MLASSWMGGCTFSSKSCYQMSDQPFSHNLDQLSNHGNNHKCGTSRGERKRERGRKKEREGAETEKRERGKTERTSCRNIMYWHSGLFKACKPLINKQTKNEKREVYDMLKGFFVT